MLLFPLFDREGVGISVKSITFVLIIFTIFAYIFFQVYINNLSKKEANIFFQQMKEKCTYNGTLEEKKYFECIPYFIAQSEGTKKYEIQFKEKIKRNIFSEFGIVPKMIKKGNLLSLFTFSFIHIGIFHLILNMWFLWLLGPNIELILGKFRFLVFYFLVGAIGALLYSFFSPLQEVPLVGSSIAISGLLGAYLILYPKNSIACFLLIILPGRLGKAEVINLPCIYYTIFWFLTQFLYFVLSLEDTAGTFLGHIFGFFVGVILIFIFKKIGPEIKVVHYYR